MSSATTVTGGSVSERGGRRPHVLPAVYPYQDLTPRPTADTTPGALTLPPLLLLHLTAFSHLPSNITSSKVSRELKISRRRRRKKRRRGGGRRDFALCVCKYFFSNFKSTRWILIYLVSAAVKQGPLILIIRSDYDLLIISRHRGNIRENPYILLGGETQFQYYHHRHI